MESEKLNLNKDFRRLYGRGKTYVNPTHIMYIMHNRKGVIRYGITTGKKVGIAVMRNRARRVIEAAFRTCVDNLNCEGADIVFVARGKTPFVTSNVVAALMEKNFIADGIYSKKEE
jgi:ribonuclease P protein component